jgi:Tfp pilus assembly major pilin PilA
MAITNVKVESTQTTRLYLASGEQAIINMFFCNQSSVSDCTLDIYAVPSGGVANSSTQIIKTLSLPATETFVFDAEKIMLGNGDAIWAQSTVDKIVVATLSSVSTA